MSLLLAGMDYVGVGNYATSFLGDTWWFAPHSVDAWLQASESGQGIASVLPCGDLYTLPLRERATKHILLRRAMLSGTGSELC